MLHKTGPSRSKQVQATHLKVRLDDSSADAAHLPRLDRQPATCTKGAQLAEKV